MNFDHKENFKLKKVVVILGPTGSGKTQWSLKLAERFGGEIISADSRQLYKKMNIGTAKEPGEWRWSGLKKKYYVNNIPHHLIDFLDPGTSFSLAEFRDSAIKYIKVIFQEGKIPFLVGGTGLYIHSVVDNLQIPRVAANKKLRNSLEEKNNEELLNWLKNLDPKTATTVDPFNKRRLIRALEVCILSGLPFSEQQTKGEPLYDFLQIGIDAPREVLYERLEKRVNNMFRIGLLEEIKKLRLQKYDWALPSMSGIGYREFRDFFDDKITLEQAIELLKKDTRNYAKRQMTWFKRDGRIKWLSSYDEAEKMVEEFLGGNKLMNS